MSIVKIESARYQQEQDFFVSMKKAFEELPEAIDKRKITSDEFYTHICENKEFETLKAFLDSHDMTSQDDEFLECFYNVQKDWAKARESMETKRENTMENQKNKAYDLEKFKCIPLLRVCTHADLKVAPLEDGRVAAIDSQERVRVVVDPLRNRFYDPDTLEAGGPIQLMMKIKEMSFGEALTDLAKAFSIEPEEMKKESLADRMARARHVSEQRNKPADEPSQNKAQTDPER